MKKYFYFAVQVEENGKYYAFVVKVSPSDNILSRLRIKNIITANICPSRKQAAALVEFWNEEHKQNRRYLFDTPIF